MKKYLTIIVLICVLSVLVISLMISSNIREDHTLNLDVDNEKESAISQLSEESQTNMPNPASKYCEENGGSIEIITDNEGAQFGLCKFNDYSCEEWAYFRGECDIEGDTVKIKDALLAKGLNLTGMKVVIHKHLGKDIVGGVVPVDLLAGGGYVFATKDDAGDIKIVADGNGAIMCEMLDDYPDFSTYLISECVDDGGNIVNR